MNNQLSISSLVIFLLTKYVGHKSSSVASSRSAATHTGCPCDGIVSPSSCAACEVANWKKRQFYKPGGCEEVQMKGRHSIAGIATEAKISWPTFVIKTKTFYRPCQSLIGSDRKIKGSRQDLKDIVEQIGS